MRHNRDGQEKISYSSRRAVSEVVAVLLLVAIVVSIGVLVFTFASGSVSALGQASAGLVGSQGNAAAERLVVEDVSFTFTGPTLGADVYVRNVGTISSTLVSVYVVDQSTGTFVGQFPVSTALAPGALVDIPHTTLTFTPSHGNTYSFTVTSSLGNSVIFDGKAS